MMLMLAEVVASSLFGRLLRVCCECGWRALVCFYTLVKLGAFCFFFSSRRRHTRSDRDWSSDVCSSDLVKRARTGLIPSPREERAGSKRDRERGLCFSVVFLRLAA